jgi:hypothetical protein
LVDFARMLARQKADELRTATWEALDAYGEQTDVVEAPDGRRFTVSSRAAWDGQEWESDLDLRVKVRPHTGWRRFWAYTERGGRGPDDDDFEPPRRFANPSW